MIVVSPDFKRIVAARFLSKTQRPAMEHNANEKAACCNKGCNGRVAEAVSNEVAALLRRARSTMEELRPNVSTASKTCMRSENENLQAEEQRWLWRRLRYLEWLHQFIQHQQHILNAVSLKQAGDGDCEREYDAAAHRSMNGAEDGGGASSSSLDWTPPSPKASVQQHDDCRGVSLQPDVVSFCFTEATAAASGEDAFRSTRSEVPVSNIASCATGGEVTVVHMELDHLRQEGHQEHQQCDLQKCVQEEEQEQQKESVHWRSFRTWHPSQVSILADMPQPHSSKESPTRHLLCLSTVVHEKPRGIRAKEAALELQGCYCKSCLCPLRKRHFPFPSWKSARFCYYTGMYYCTNCHSGRTSAIPARALHMWDFQPLPVCNDALDFMELQRERPLYCVSAVNPKLYHRVVLLQMIRYLRLQVMALREVGVQCRVFRHLFYNEDAVLKHTSGGCLAAASSVSAAATTTAADDDSVLHREFFVQRDKRYLMEDSEVWSFADLEDVHRCQSDASDGCDAVSAFTVQVASYSRPMAVTVSCCDAAVFLRRLRAQMVYHILRRQCDVCLRNSLDVCRWCCPPDVVTAFQQGRDQGQKQQQQQQQERQQEREDDNSSPLSSASFSRRAFQSVWTNAPGASHLFTVYSFDLLHVRSCPRCGACYHKRCFYKLQREMLGVTGCLRCYKGSDAVRVVCSSRCPPCGTYDSSSSSFGEDRS
ncbi:hypothetical protein DQ04_03031020 [Trypanosoma grayi]|uniref:hypothetical protein n=1 Tax=Trypanosoma grayi TaxID=71804 RepID=UPI0004F40EA5|nr:hypothetical protein DQ04_03031020 [Trypanosoma grayi]KEG11044.1 hypothetical protein DQ04_03031020 [Trypanosoma grayi]